MINILWTIVAGRRFDSHNIKENFHAEKNDDNDGLGWAGLGWAGQLITVIISYHWNAISGGWIVLYISLNGTTPGAPLAVLKIFLYDGFPSS